MSEGVTAGNTFEVVCPHCKKEFSAKLLAGGTPAHRGFKCPHCRLFVPIERTDADELLARATP